MRQALVDAAVFDDSINASTNMDLPAKLEMHQKIVKGAIERGDPIGYSALVEQYALGLLRVVSHTYTRGDSIESIDNSFVQPSIPRLELAYDEMNSNMQLEKQTSGTERHYFFWGLSSDKDGNSALPMTASDVLNLMVFVSYARCFKIPDSTMEKLAPVLIQPGKNELVDKILSHLPCQSSSTSSQSNASYPEPKPLFVALNEIYDAPTSEKPALISSYLKNWAKILSGSRGDGGINTLGHSILKAHKTNKTLPKEIVGRFPNYRGNWAWEIVCLVKLLDIDDSSFRDHELYPVDMVDYVSANR